MKDTPGRPSPPVEKLLGMMETWGASDLFLTVGKVPALRLHGSVVPYGEVSETSSETIGTFIEKAVPSGMREAFEESGDLDVGYSLPDGRRFRLNLARTQGRTSLVARALPSGELEFEDLGLPEGVRRLADLGRGLVLVTGATGSGKSTTLAAMLHHINVVRRAHVVTIEEPVEFVHADIKSRITQREVGIDTGSFDVALRQVLRESPDVILIGEMRDISTMRVALQAALTGHLVLTTLHTIDSTQTVQRILSYFPEHQREQVAHDLSLCLEGIVSQRLLPRKGGDGRVLAAELLTMTPAARRLVAEQRYDELVDLMKTSGDGDLVAFDRALLDLYRRGLVSHATGLAHASNPEEFELGCRGMETGVATFRDGQETSGDGGLDMKTLLAMVLERRASDLHLSVGRPPMLRIDGQLVETDLPVLGSGDVRMLIHSILGVRQRTTFELDRELDFSLSIEGGHRFRVNAYHEKGKPAAALRSIESAIPGADDLGLPASVLEMGDEPQGLLLVVGPTGSGKTTTLACLVDRINHSRRCHVITVEDPIEYTHASDVATIHQREVGADTLSFAAALRHVLRQDPDVVLVGELRDLESIAAAITAAETGHLVMATLHTNDAIQTIDRIIDVFPPHQQAQMRTQLAACLLGVVSQRLLPRADGEGRIAAFEVMVANAAIRTLIRDNKLHQAMSVLQSSGKQGMITLDRSLANLLADGRIAREEAMRHVRNPAYLDEVKD